MSKVHFIIKEDWDGYDVIAGFLSLDDADAFMSQYTQEPLKIMSLNIGEVHPTRTGEYIKSDAEKEEGRVKLMDEVERERQNLKDGEEVMECMDGSYVVHKNGEAVRSVSV